MVMVWKGIKNISDIIDDDDKFIRLMSWRINTIYIAIFLDYYSLINAIPNVWKRSIKRGEDIGNSQSDVLIQICSSRKICKLIHRICVDKLFKTPKCVDKWADFFEDMNLDWVAIYQIPMLSSRFTKLHYFQFKVLHRYIGVNENLYKFGYVDSNLCTFCNVEIESIPHLFWQCDISTRFWKDVQDHVLKKNVILTMKDDILVILDTDNSIYNFVILHAKQYMYNARWNDHRLNVTAFKKQLENIYTIEKYIAEKNDKVEEWQKKWNSINMWLPFI